MKMHVFDRKQPGSADPTFYVQLSGSHNDTGNLFVKV